MRDIAKRLARIERQRDASKPIAPCLVIRHGKDEATELAAFRLAHDGEPWRVFTIKRAPPRP